MSRGMKVNHEDIAINNMERTNKHNNTKIKRPLTLKEQLDLQKIKIREKIKAQQNQELIIVEEEVRYANWASNFVPKF